MHKPPVNDPDVLLDQRQVAVLLRVTTKFLEKRRCVGGGPEFLKLGSLVRYKRASVLAWADQQRRASTSESAQR